MATVKQTGDYVTKATAEKNAKQAKKRGASNVRVSQMRDKLGRKFYRVSYTIQSRISIQ